MLQLHTHTDSAQPRNPVFIPDPLCVGAHEGLGTNYYGSVDLLGQLRENTVRQ